jgi:hypothetical protein
MPNHTIVLYPLLSFAFLPLLSDIIQQHIYPRFFFPETIYKQMNMTPFLSRWMMTLFSPVCRWPMMLYFFLFWSHSRLFPFPFRLTAEHSSSPSLHVLSISQCLCLLSVCYLVLSFCNRPLSQPFFFFPCDEIFFFQSPVFHFTFFFPGLFISHVHSLSLPLHPSRFHLPHPSLIPILSPSPLWFWQLKSQLAKQKKKKKKKPKR